MSSRRLFTVIFTLISCGLLLLCVIPNTASAYAIVENPFNETPTVNDDDADGWTVPSDGTPTIASSPSITGDSLAFTQSDGAYMGLQYQKTFSSGAMNQHHYVSFWIYPSGTPGDAGFGVYDMYHYRMMQIYDRDGNDSWHVMASTNGASLPQASAADCGYLLANDWNFIVIYVNGDEAGSVFINGELRGNILPDIDDSYTILRYNWAFAEDAGSGSSIYIDNMKVSTDKPVYEVQYTAGKSYTPGTSVAKNGLDTAFTVANYSIFNQTGDHAVYDFGDSSSTVTTYTSPFGTTHTYASAGSYSATVTFYNSDNTTVYSTETIPVTVTASTTGGTNTDGTNNGGSSGGGVYNPPNNDNNTTAPTPHTSYLWLAILGAIISIIGFVWTAIPKRVLVIIVGFVLIVIAYYLGF